MSALPLVVGGQAFSCESCDLPDRAPRQRAGVPFTVSVPSVLGGQAFLPDRARERSAVPFAMQRSVEREKNMLAMFDVQNATISGSR